MRGSGASSVPLASSSAPWPVMTRLLRPPAPRPPHRRRLPTPPTTAATTETMTAKTTTKTTATTTQTSTFSFPPMAPLPEGVEHGYHPYGRHGATISYYHSRAHQTSPRGAVVFISGFGVGGWHYERNLPALAKEGYSCFAPDLLGQGRSWPRGPHPLGDGGGGAVAVGVGSDDSFDSDGGGGGGGAERTNDDGTEQDGSDDARVLRYSVDEWVEQLRRFVVEVALPRTSSGADDDKKVALVGNSLGGFLAVQLAARYPELVRGVALLNATPFWAFQKKRSALGGGVGAGGGAALWSWSWPPAALDGRVPAPGPITGLIRRLWWDNMRRPDTVEALLAQVYANPCSFRCDGSTAARILEATEHPLAVDAFVSIALSPKPALDFDDALASPQARSVPFLICGGERDPWVHPWWLRRARRLRPDAPLWLIEGSGHCPAHESPTAVNASLARWLAWLEQGGGFVGQGGGPPPPLAVGEAWSFRRGGGGGGDGGGGGGNGDGVELLPFEADTTVRSDPGDPTTALGKLERLLFAGFDRRKTDV